MEMFPKKSNKQNLLLYHTEKNNNMINAYKIKNINRIKIVEYLISEILR